MRHFVIVSMVITATLLTFRLVASAQQVAPGQTADAKPPRPGLEVPLVTPGPGWKACPHCENEAYKADGRKKANVDTRAFNLHDIAGVWSGNPNDLEVNGLPMNMTAVPSFTPYGRKLFEADQSDSPQWNSKDPENTCDPMGWPRWLTFNYGFEFVVLPDRVLQFFEWVIRGGTSGLTGANCRRILRFSDTWDMLLADGKEIRSLLSRMAMTTGLGLRKLRPSVLELGDRVAIRIATKCGSRNATSESITDCFR